MKKTVITALVLLIAAGAFGQIPTQRIAEDAKVIDRVAEASKRDLPGDLLKRILNEDIDLLRGKRTDGSYQYATYERLEAGRISDSFSIQPRKNVDLEKWEVRGPWTYRLLVSSPSRRMVVTRNRRVWIDRVELQYIPQGSSETQFRTFKVESWLEPGGVKPFDFPEVARQATARVFVRADDEAGYGNIVLTLIEARIIDNADSPYADAVNTAKAIVRAIDNGEIPSIRAMATRLHGLLAGAEASAPAPTAAGEPSAATVEVVSPAIDPGELHRELQSIEDLLTGDEEERRQGLDRLHQLVRRVRP